MAAPELLSLGCEEIVAGESDPLLGVSARLRKEVPFRELCGDTEVVGGTGWTAGDVSGFEGFDGVGGALLAGAKLGEADHPGGVLVGEQIETG